MKKRFFAMLIGTVLSLQCLYGLSAGMSTVNAEGIPVWYEYPEVLTISEGETVQLTLPDYDLPEINYVNFYTNSKSAMISSDLKLTGVRAGTENISLYVGYKDITLEQQIDIKVNILESDSVSDEARAEIERLDKIFGFDFQRRKMELVGAPVKDTPRISLEKMYEIIDDTDDYREILMKLNNYAGFPDEYYNGDQTSCSFWLDDKGNESISYSIENKFIAYQKVDDNGTVVGVQGIYPQKTELLENGKDKSYEYIHFNQVDKVPPEGYGTLKLTLIDQSTGEPFTDTNGVFRLIERNGASDRKIIKTWDSSEGSEITIDGLSREYSYELCYIDDFHDVSSESCKYVIDSQKYKNIFSFESEPECTANVYLKKRSWNDPFLLGDVNCDDLVNVADIVVLQSWLLGRANIVLLEPRAADLCNDNRIDVIDLCRLKQMVSEKIMQSIDEFEKDNIIF